MCIAEERSIRKGGCVLAETAHVQGLRLCDAAEGVRDAGIAFLPGDACVMRVELPGGFSFSLE